MTKLKVLMIRERDEMLLVSSCCPRLGGDFTRFRSKKKGVEYMFADRRKTMKEMGAIYLAIKERFGESAEIVLMDPRNGFPLLWHLGRDVFSYRPPLGKALRVLTVSFPFPAVVANGRLIASGEMDDPEAIVGLIEETCVSAQGGVAQ